MCALACACGLALTAEPSKADEFKPPAKKAGKIDATEQLLEKLEQEVRLREDRVINEVPLFELIQTFGKEYELTFVINEVAFKQAGIPDIKEAKPNLTGTPLRGLTLRQLLLVTLDSIGATYLVKGATIEIVPIQFAAKVTKSSLSRTGDEGHAQLNEPLVSAIFKEKPLNEAAAKIAEMYDLTVVVAPQAADVKATAVTARILNMPADKAIELLALQSDLRVVRRGPAYLLTTKEHANELFREKLEQERQKIETQKFREMTVKPPAPPAPKM
jgi:hypothetical protein